MQADPRIKEIGLAKYQEYRTWFDQKLDDAIKAAESQKQNYQDSHSIQSEWIFFLILSCLCYITLYVKHYTVPAMYPVYIYRIFLSRCPSLLLPDVFPPV